MRTTTFILAITCMASLAACGSKSKKNNSTVTDTGSGTGTGNEASSKDGTTIAPDIGTDPSLQEIVFFEFDSTELDEAARKKLEENGEWMKADAQRTLTIEGHTDEVGTPEYNLGLGERRAQISRDYLLRLGIEPNRISIITFGEEKPASSEDSENRRSMFVATRKK